MLNTTDGPVEVDREPRGPVNTSRITEEDLVYEGEGPEILAVVPATGHYAEMKDGALIPLLVFVVTDEGEMYGTTLTSEGGIDLSYDVGQHADFFRYTNELEKEK